MITNIYNGILLLLAFLPFMLFAFFDTKANLKKKVRNRQYFMPLFALVYCIVLFINMNRLSNLCVSFFEKIEAWLNSAAEILTGIKFLAFGSTAFEFVSNAIHRFLTEVNIIYVILILFNAFAMLLYIILKGIVLGVFGHVKNNTSLTNKIVGIFYDYDEKTDLWYIKRHFGQAKTFLKTVFYATAVISMIAVFVSFYLCKAEIIKVPFYPVFAIILIGELAFFIDGVEFSELSSEFSAEIDNSRHVTNYAFLRKKLKELFGDKLTSEGTTVNDNIIRGGSIDQILSEIDSDYGRAGKNYSMFIRHKMKNGLDPDADYVRAGIELASGKSLLFNTPFYYKLSPYAFYAMHSTLLRDYKVLIVLGRHGTTDDVREWCDNGLFETTNLPSLWNIRELDKSGEEPDIGIVTRSGVHDLELHRANKDFLNKVAFVVLIEPSRLVTTAQIGLNLLVRNISVRNNAVYCSFDKNCDGLVDSLSHILMTNITEVSATEYPQGTSSYMCWNADGDYLQHRITPGISRYLGMGTEISFTALKNNVERTMWYGGDAFPVLDEHWIAKQYYHKLLATTPLPATQNAFDKFFKVSFNTCNEKVRENSFITVEDEFNNLFEVKREFATMSRNQGFVNVISSDYMLRGYMTENEEIFNSDPKAIPYVSADYARTGRNVILKICLKMSIHGIYKDELVKELLLAGMDVNENDLEKILWKEICAVFCTDGTSEIIVNTPKGQKIFTRDVVEHKRDFSSKTGRFEDIFVITNNDFKQYVIDDLQSAKYIAERGNESTFLGTELKGHVLQKYLPGQFVTLNGKYYEMLYLTQDNQVIIRRASDHINGRFSYRQTRKYRLDFACDNEEMGMLKTINGIRIYNQFGDFVVDTPSYWRMNAYNDFENGSKVLINNIPQRRYFRKHILKLDFSEFKGVFTPEIRATITLMMNEVFKTLFAENQPYIAAVTEGDFEKPLTYSLSGDGVCEDCIYVIEDSQLDLGLLVAVERNFERIMQIVSDYLAWNKSMLEVKDESASEYANTPSATVADENNEGDEKGEDKKKPAGFFRRLWEKIKSIFTRKKKDKKKGKKTAATVEPTDIPVEEPIVPIFDEDTSSESADAEAVDADAFDAVDEADKDTASTDAWSDAESADAEAVDTDAFDAVDEADKDTDPTDTWSDAESADAKTVDADAFDTVDEADKDTDPTDAWSDAESADAEAVDTDAFDAVDEADKDTASTDAWSDAESADAKTVDTDAFDTVDEADKDTDPTDAWSDAESADAKTVDTDAFDTVDEADKDTASTDAWSDAESADAEAVDDEIPNAAKKEGEPDVSEF